MCFASCGESWTIRRTPRVLEFSRLVFGLNSSPFLAQHVTQEHTHTCKAELPRATEAITLSTYMDDTLDSDPAVQGLDLHLGDLWNVGPEVGDQQRLRDERNPTSRKSATEGGEHKRASHK